MIADISKGSFVAGLIKYNEEKVNEGIAEVLFDPTISGTISEKNKIFLDVNGLRPDLKKNNIVHISLSLNPEDKEIVNDDFLKIANQYLDKMGYENCPHLIYKHDDKVHQHIHIITTAVDFDGNRVNDSGDWKKSQKISRDLEKSFNLIPTTYDKIKNLQLGEINEKKYRITNSLSKIKNIPILMDKIGEIIKKEDLDKIIVDKYNNEEIKEFLKKCGYEEKTFDKIYRELKNNDVLTETKKERLISTLTHFKSISQGTDEFMRRVQDHGLYVRIITGKGEKKFVFGDPKESFYLNEKQLPSGLKHSILFNLEYLKNEDYKRQRIFMKRIVTKAVSKAISVNHLSEILKTNNIKIDFARNSKGIYGATFESMNTSEPIKFKGQDLDRALTWKNIERGIELNKMKVSEKTGMITKVQKDKPSEKVKPEITKGMNLKKFGKSLDEPSEEEKKKNKKDKDRGEDMEHDY